MARRSPEDNYTPYIPFVRWFKPAKTSETERKLSGFSIWPEIIYVALVYLSARVWNDGIVTLVIWCVALLLLMTLALTNAKTKLSPDVLTRPLAGVGAVFAVVLSTHFSSTWLTFSAALGALIVAGVPYVLFQVSKGKWIGGGDVKLGLAAGLLLGWNYGLLCLALMIVLTLLSFFIEYVAGKATKTGVVSYLGTGTLWTIAVTICILVRQ